MFFLIAYKFQPKNKVSDIPIEPMRCGANFNGTIYDMSELDKLKNVYTFEDKTKTYKYYVSLCDDLPKDKVPEGVARQFGTNGVRVNQLTNYIEPFAFHDTQFYELQDYSKPEEGFVITTYAQATEPNIAVKFFKLTFVFVPSETPDTQPQQTGEFEIDDVLNIYLMFSTSYAKPKKGPLPPDPPLPPTCKYTNDSKSVFPYAIVLNLNDLNLGPHGIPITFNDMYDMFALYQPCGISKCPYDFNCSVKQASAWVCYRENMRCEGFASTPVEFSMTYEDPDEGIRVKYKNIDDNELQVDTICNFDLTDDQMYVMKSHLVHDSSLQLRVATKQACFRPLHNDDPSRCKAHLEDKITTLDVDLTKYNLDVTGYEFNVTNDKFTNPHWVNIQPCGALACPSDHCPTGVGATVYLCEELEDNTNVCFDYGMYRGQINVEKFMSMLNQGVSVNYYGNDGRHTHVKIYCNRSLEAGKLSFQPNVYFATGGQLSLFAQSRDVCVDYPTRSPTPQPSPEQWWPPNPVPRTDKPTPKQLKPTVFTQNDKRSIVFDTYNAVNMESITIVSPQGKTANGFIQYTPFNMQKSPSGYRGMGISDSDCWICWNGNCYPMQMGPAYGIDYDKTYNDEKTTVYSDGYYDTKLVFDYICDTHAYSPVFSSQIKFDGSKTYSSEVRWADACPKAIHVPVWPPKPTPTPKPHDVPFPITFSDRTHNYDLADFGNTTVDMYLGIGSQLVENIQLRFKPSGIIKCPDDAYCGGADYSTAWKCWVDPVSQQTNCLSMADTRFPPYTISSEEIVYAGGYANYVLTVNLLCNANQTTMKLMDLATATLDNKVKLYMIGKDFCEGKMTYNHVTGGAVFLILVVVLPTLYVALCTSFNFLYHGEATVPHWHIIRAFKDSLMYGISFVITCGRPRTSGTYDAI